MKKAISMLVCLIMLTTAIVQAQSFPVQMGDIGETRGGYVQMEALATALGWELYESDIDGDSISISYYTPYCYEIDRGDRWYPISFSFQIGYHPAREISTAYLFLHDDVSPGAEVGGHMWSFEDLSEIPLDVPAQIINDRTLLPLRAISESLGATVGRELIDGVNNISISIDGYNPDEIGFVQTQNN